MYVYLYWVALLGISWLVGYFSYPKLRKKMLWSSLLATPFGAGELYFIPTYWMPKTLFNFGLRYGLDLEAFGLMFFLGGLAALAYEGILKKHIPSGQKICNPCTCYVPLVTTLAFFVVLIRAFPAWNIIYPASFACLAGGIAALLLYPKLRMHIIYGGIIFTALYWTSLVIIEFLFPGWIASTWNMAILSNIRLVAVPIEELLFAFSFGTLWAPLYEEVCSNFHITKR